MKSILSALILVFTVTLLPKLQAQQLSAYQQALYDKSRYDTLLALSNNDLASYCITNNVRSETLGKLSSEIAAAEAELRTAASAGLRMGNPKIDSLNANILGKRQAYEAEIKQIRKGIEVDRRVAQNTLATLRKAREYSTPPK